jgi:glycosyltransferase involved in cell wall biosynthesis
MVHNYYLQRGGEDYCFESEIKLLKQNKHQVFTYTKHNSEFESFNFIKKASKLVWNREVYAEFSKIIDKFKPDIIHCHNTFPLISPSIYYAAKSKKVPIVQTLHNYRVSCPAATFYRGEVCEDCLGKWFCWPSIFHRCYRRSVVANFLVSVYLMLHKLIGTWTKKVDKYIALTNFCKEKFIEVGLPSKNIVVKPNFIFKNYSKRKSIGSYFLFVGRLTKEKGVMQLIKTWKQIPDLHLKIVGDGPLKSEVAKYLKENQISNVYLLGPKTHSETIKLIRKSCAVIFPSEWYETFGLVIAESFANGVPVVASNLGVMSELVTKNKTGLLFDLNNIQDLIPKLYYLFAQKNNVQKMGSNAYSDYKSKFTKEKNYKILIKIYKDLKKNH